MIETNDEGKDNAVEEGFEYTFDPSIVPSRVKNHTQIFTRSGVVSETQEAVDDAGNAAKLRHQKVLKGLALKKDVEYAIFNNQASVGGTTRKSAGLPSFITSNVSRGAGGVNGGYNTGTGLTAAATNGTQRAFTQTLLDSIMLTMKLNGAKPRMGYVSPYLKSVFVSFISNPNNATQRYAVTDGKNNSIISNADIYEGPHGVLVIKEDEQLARNSNIANPGNPATARNIFMMDPEFAEWLWLRPIANVPDLANTHDAKKFVIKGEGCLKVKNEKAHAIIADVFGVSAAA
jgi:hypothetical protein